MREAKYASLAPPAGKPGMHGALSGVAARRAGGPLLGLLSLLLLPALSAKLPQPSVNALEDLPPTKSITHELLLLLDLDRSGQVSFDEFDRLLEQYNLQSADHFDIAPDEGTRLFRQLDIDADSGISQEEIAIAMRRNSTFVRMSSEDVQVWLDCCTDGLKQYRAHFLETEAKGIDLVHATRHRAVAAHNPTSFSHSQQASGKDDSRASANAEASQPGRSSGASTARATTVAQVGLSALPSDNGATTPMFIDGRDQRYLRAAVIGGLLRSYYRSSHEPILPAPKLIEARSTIITVGIVQPPSLSYRSRVVKYKVQACRTSGEFGWHKLTNSVPECGFGWDSIWPSTGVSTVRFVGLSAMTSYRFRVRAFHCDGKSIVGEELDIRTMAPHTKKSILLSPTKWPRVCFLNPLMPSKPHVVSTTPNSVLLEWGRSCKVRASYLRMLSECSSVPHGPGWDIPGLAQMSSFVRSQMYCTRQRFIVQYVEYGSDSTKSIRSRWSLLENLYDKKVHGKSETDPGDEGDNDGDESIDGSLASQDKTFLPGTVTDALCSQQDDSAGPNGGNDNPLDCLVRDLRPGKMYLFRLAVEADGMRSEFTEPVPHMTHCISDEDCTSWIDTPNATCNPSTRFCDGLDPRLLTGASSAAFDPFPSTFLGYIQATYDGSSILLSMITTMVLCIFALRILDAERLGYGNRFSMHGGRWPGRRRRYVQDYHVPPRPVLTEYAGDMVGLERLHMKNMDKWPGESLRGGSGFDKLHFLKAFDIKFGKTVYRVTKYLGGGSFGRVFLATAQVRKKNASWYSRCLKRAGGFRPKGESVAIKFLPNSNMPEVIPGTLARREKAKFVGQTLFWTTDQNVWSHPSAPPNPFVVMETAEMGEIRNYQANSLREGPKFFREEVARRIFSQLLQAVAFLHQNRFLHLDIKLENVLINIRGDVKLIDFGCSKQMEQGVLSKSVRNKALGTNKNASIKSDSPLDGEKKVSESSLQQASIDTHGNSFASDLSVQTDGRGSRAASVLSSDTTSSNISNVSRSAYAAMTKPTLAQTYRPIEMSYDEAENCGSKCIRAPELMPSYDDERPARCDVRSDLWSCGVCLLSMLQGTYDLVSQEVKDNVLVDGQYHLYLSDWENVLDVLSCYGEGGAVVSVDAQDLLAGLLQPDPEFRFQSAREVLNHDWLQMKMADDDMLASMMVANNADQVQKGLALIPEGTAEQVLPFYISLDRELKSRKKMLEKMRDSSKPKDDEYKKKTYSPHRRPNQRRLSHLASYRMMNGGSTTSPDGSPGSSPSPGKERKIAGGFKAKSQLTRAVDMKKNGSEVDIMNRKGSERSPLHGKSSPNNSSSSEPPESRSIRHRSSTFSMTNSESLLGPFSETALARFQRDHLKFPKHWKGPIEWLFQFRQITHPAQVNPALLKQAIRDVEPGIKDSMLTNRLKWFKKKLSTCVVKPLRFPELRMSMRQFSSRRTLSGNRTPSGGATPTNGNAMDLSIGRLRTGSGPARARRNRIKYSDVLSPLGPDDTRVMSSAAQSFSRIKGLRRRRQSFSLGAKAFQQLNPQPLSLTRASSDGNDGSVKFPGSISRMSSRTSSLWIQVRTVEDGVCWTDEQLDYLRNDFGISNEWSSNDELQPSSFSIDGQRLSDLSKALGLGDNPIDTLLERSKKAIAEQAAAAHVKAAADAQVVAAGQLLERQATIPISAPLPLQVYTGANNGVSPASSPMASPLKKNSASSSLNGAFSAAELVARPDLGAQPGVSGVPLPERLRSVTETSSHPSVNSTTPIGTKSTVSTPSGRPSEDEADNANGALVLTPVMKSRVYIEHQTTEELRLDLLKEQQAALKSIVERQILETFSEKVANTLANFSLANSGNGLDEKLLRQDEPEQNIQKESRLVSLKGHLSSHYDPVLLANSGLTWFKDFHPDLQARIYSLFRIYRFAPGQPICNRNEWVHGMHVIVSGGAYVNDFITRGVEPLSNVTEEPVKWLQPFEIINAHILEGVIAETKAPQRGNGSDENDKGSDSLNSTTALEVGHMLSQVTIVAAEETTYDSDSTSEDDDARSVVSTREPSGTFTGGCTTLFLDARRVKDVLVQAIEKGMVLDTTAV